MGPTITRYFSLAAWLAGSCGERGLCVEERERLLDVPNAFPYVRCIETEKAGYLIRQFLYGSLYDRIR